VLGPEEYQKIKCDFHFADKIAELDEIESAIKLELGAQDDLAQIMISIIFSDNIFFKLKMIAC
jgi:hypothetical protein